MTILLREKMNVDAPTPEERKMLLEMPAARALIAEAVAAERQRCAAVCMAFAGKWGCEPEECAAAILGERGLPE